eukprot:scaffold14879_cov122-Isochrysis_galbana.AAC.2
MRQVVALAQWHNCVVRSLRAAWPACRCWRACAVCAARSCPGAHVPTPRALVGLAWVARRRGRLAQLAQAGRMAQGHKANSKRTPKKSALWGSSQSLEALRLHAHASRACPCHAAASCSAGVLLRGVGTDGCRTELGFWRLTDMHV